MNEKSNVKVKSLRTDKRFSVSMAVIATVAILAIGSTSTIVMAHRGHHSGSGSSDSGSGDLQPTCGFAQTVGNDGLCHYSVQGAINACQQHLPECISLSKLVLGGL
ncbi:MAG: hypothetical protein M3044_05915 [Thermoproteota archaeon]|nr:hypothetical protein [Thermoproteota archaeon]